MGSEMCIRDSPNGTSSWHDRDWESRYSEDLWKVIESWIYIGCWCCFVSLTTSNRQERQRPSEYQSSWYQSFQRLASGSLSFRPPVTLGTSEDSILSGPGTFGTCGTKSFQPRGGLGTGSSKITETRESLTGSRGLGLTFSRLRPQNAKPSCFFLFGPLAQ